MNAIKHFLWVAMLLSAAACSEPTDGPTGTDPVKPQECIVKGRVVDGQGKPVANATIVASSTDWHNKTSTGYTDANGYYKFQLPTGIAEGSYTTDGTVTMNYHGKNYKLALYNEDTRVFSAYDGAVRNFVFRLTGKRAVDDDETAIPLGGTLEVHYQWDNVVGENLELTLEPVGPLVDGSTGKKIVATMREDSNYFRDIPVGQYKITARDKVTGQQLGVTIKDSFKAYESSVTGLFKEVAFEGDTRYELILLVDKL